MRQTPGVRLADWSADPDHNRLVVTFVGPPAPVRAAALAAAAAAVERIDLGGHQGVHPRLGALDVLPFVPLRGLTLADCAALARDVGQELAARHGLPIFLYEAASADARSLPFVRKEAFHPLLPDFGPPYPTRRQAPPSSAPRPPDRLQRRPRHARSVHRPRHRPRAAGRRTFPASAPLACACPRAG